MNKEKLNYAMQYVDDDLLMEFFQIDDKLEAERKTARRRHFRTFAAVASVMIIVILTGVIFNKRMNDVSEKTTAIATGIDLVADPILLNQEKYHMFADSPFVRGYLAEHGFPSDYGANTIGEKRGYLDMAANKVDGRLCFSSTEEKTNYILYSYGNTNEDEFLIIQSDNHYYLLIKEGIAD